MAHLFRLVPLQRLMAGNFMPMDLTIRAYQKNLDLHSGMAFRGWNPLLLRKQVKSRSTRRRRPVAKSRSKLERPATLDLFSRDSPLSPETYWSSVTMPTRFCHAWIQPESFTVMDRT